LCRIFKFGTIYFIRYMKKLLLLILIFLSELVNAQDSIKINDNIHIDFGLTFRQLYQTATVNEDRIIDPAVNNHRLKDTLEYFSPFFHCATYVSPSFKISYKDKLYLNFITYFEHRGWSNGSYDQGMNRVFSEFSFGINDSIKLFKTKTSVNLLVGNMFNENEEEFGVKAYNIDMQGIKFKAQMKDYSLNLLYSSDFMQQMGLLIDEYIRVQLGKNMKTKSGKMRSSFSLSFDYNGMIDSNRMNRYNRFSSGLQYSVLFDNNLKMYFLTDYLLNGRYNSSNPASNFTVLLKLHYMKLLSKNTSFSIVPKLRFFGNNYISENYENGFGLYPYRYRYIGNPRYSYSILYPLKSYFRDVSQYAFYTEYRHSNNILSLELDVHTDFLIFRNIRNEVKLETFSIKRDFRDRNDFFSYIFISNFLYINLYEGFKGGIYISNKQMNQDVQYQTFYQMKYPYIGFYFIYNGNFKLKNIFKE